jgi:2-keto-4-pentenoate hydratase
MLTDADLRDCALRLHEAQRTCRPVDLLSLAHPGLDENWAYRIQDEGLRLRGGRRAGFKLGYTSAAMRAQMNIDHPNFGVLTADQAVDPALAVLDRSALIHPRVEPEIALLVGRRIAGGGHDRNSIWRHVDAALPAIEIVDTRYHEYRFTIADNIADNSSSARFATGAPCSLRRCGDLRLAGVVLSCGARPLDQGTGANALGDPLLALAWLANFLDARGQAIEEGSVILTGGLTKAHEAGRGDCLIGEFGGLGSVRVQFD